VEFSTTNTLQLITMIVLASGVWVARSSIDNARKISRQKAAMDYLNELQENSRYKECVHTVRKIHHDEDRDIKHFAYEKHRDDTEADSIRYLLNMTEQMFIGIKHEIYDEATIKDSRCNVTVQIYDMCKGFIEELHKQTGKKTVYQELLKKGQEWSDNPLRNTAK